MNIIRPLVIACWIGSRGAPHVDSLRLVVEVVRCQAAIEIQVAAVSVTFDVYITHTVVTNRMIYIYTYIYIPSGYLT